jgi:hypothetical protein
MQKYPRWCMSQPVHLTLARTTPLWPEGFRPRLQVLASTSMATWGTLPKRVAGELPAVKAKVLYAVQEPFHKALLSGKTNHAAWREKPSAWPRYKRVGTSKRTFFEDAAEIYAVLVTSWRAGGYTKVGSRL